ncbi:MAG TPA: hypothetical protein VNJ01_12840 [Bacteriovoracaceae bacterium]|nr:hypothetical protein [Bacteriovoracaceae bacterium]
MKVFMAWLLLMVPLLSSADEVKVEINPSKPVAGEVFQAYFRIFTEADEEPVITFTPSSLEVVGKANQGVSTKTIYANGKLTVTREMTVAYDLVASKPGIVGLRDINVQLGSTNLRHSALTINVLKEPETLAEIFLMADVPKKKLIVGEGITVRYFLYSRVSFNNVDVKKYPKLNNFLKRFLQEPDRAERVSVNGEVYQRNQIYAVKLFPEKVGELTVDPMTISVTYAVANAADPFGSFGFNREVRTRSLSSEVIKIQSRALPAPVPPHFTGLVGKHDFELKFNQQKLIVNEPLEVKLTVAGVGALENLEAPTILKHQGLEEFESNGDLKITDSEQATKVFDYTFLAKDNLTLPASEITLSYLNPETDQYVASSLPIPEIVVAGGRAFPGTEGRKDQPLRKQDPASSVAARPPVSLASPVTVTSKNLREWLPVVNFSLAAFSLVMVLTFFVQQNKIKLFRKSADVPAEFKRGDFKFSSFVTWMSPLIQQTGKSPLVIIKESPLPEDSKTYFFELLNSSDSKDYSTLKTDLNYTYRPTHFKNLSRYIESAKKNENLSQPS